MRTRPSRQGLLIYCLSLTGLPDCARFFRQQARYYLSPCTGAFIKAVRHVDKVLLTILLVYFFHGGFCQPSTGIISEFPYPANDFIIDNNHDTIAAEFVLPHDAAMPYGDSVWMQDQIIVRIDQSLKTLLPGDIAGFRYNGVDHESVTLSQKRKSEVDKFCRRLLSGEISVYACHEVTDGNTGPNAIIQLYYRHEGANANLFNYHWTRLGRIPEISERIRDGTIQRDEFLAAVNELNGFLQPKTSH